LVHCARSPSIPRRSPLPGPENRKSEVAISDDVLCSISLGETITPSSDRSSVRSRDRRPSIHGPFFSILNARSYAFTDSLTLRFVPINNDISRVCRQRCRCETNPYEPVQTSYRSTLSGITPTSQIKGWECTMWPSP
jgi:hypothetical protein